MYSFPSNVSFVPAGAVSLTNGLMSRRLISRVVSVPFSTIMVRSSFLKKSLTRLMSWLPAERMKPLSLKSVCFSSINRVNVPSFFVFCYVSLSLSRPLFSAMQEIVSSNSEVDISCGAPFMAF